MNAKWLVTSHEFSELFYALTIQSFTPSPAQEVFWGRWIWLQVDDMFLANTGKILENTHTKIKLKKKHIYCISTWCSSTSWFFGTLIFFKPKIIIASGKSPGWRPPRDSSRGGSVGYIFSPANLHRFFTPRHPPPCLRCVPQVTRGCFKVRIPEKTKAQKWNVQKIGELNKGS